MKWKDRFYGKLDKKRDKERKQTIKRQVIECEDFLNDARDKLNKECAGLMPYPAKVVFIDEDGEEITSDE